jgi:phosphoadenosine phosphosulfate reductase
MKMSLETLPSREILSWAYQHVGEQVAISTAFGPSGVVLMHLAAQVCPGAKVFFIDTGFHFKETMEMVDRVSSRIDVNIEVIEPEISLKKQALVYGDALHVVDPDKCCTLRKVEPTRKMMSQLDGWITALRRDQGPSRANTPVLEHLDVQGRMVSKINPLVRWTKEEIWRHIFAHDLPYNPLKDQGYASVGCAPCTQPATDPNDERSGRWSGRQKTECGLHTAL